MEDGEIEEQDTVSEKKEEKGEQSKECTDTVMEHEEGEETEERDPMHTAETERAPLPDTEREAERETGVAMDTDNIDETDEAATAEKEAAMTDEAEAEAETAEEAGQEGQEAGGWRGQVTQNRKERKLARKLKRAKMQHAQEVRQRQDSPGYVDALGPAFATMPTGLALFVKALVRGP